MVDTATTKAVPAAAAHATRQGYWRGVLAMDFSVSEIKAFLVSAMQGGQEGEYQLYDSHLNLLASSAPGNVLTLLSP
ncbi:hypothetical protein JTM18_35760, partial [Pseudomonas aeruginosa]|nr:hypothetical protein [Pseudomonas aeruginosa]